MQVPPPSLASAAHTTALAHKTGRLADTSGVRPRSSLSRLGLISPTPTKEMPFVLGSHGGESHHAHDQEDQEENYGNHEDWHTSPLRPLWGGSEPRAVIAITARCEETTSAAALTKPGDLDPSCCPIACGSANPEPPESAATAPNSARWCCAPTAAPRGCATAAGPPS